MALKASFTLVKFVGKAVRDRGMILPLLLTLAIMVKRTQIKMILFVSPIEMKGITRCKLTIISESAIHKKFLGQIISYLASL